MKSLSFPVFKTKTESTATYDLTSPADRKKYFAAKIGKEIAELREYLRDNSFIGYLLGKKHSGKGTYSKLFTEIFGPDSLVHISIGDVTREVTELRDTGKGYDELLDYLKRNYRGFMSLDDALANFFSRTPSTLVSTEFILALAKWEIDKYPGKSLFIDGFPRNLDQVAYALYFRDLIGHRADPDIFILLDVPEAIIDERIKQRRACPKCQTSRGLRLNPTSIVEYDKKAGEFFLRCDNPDCSGERMVPKEGDDLGVESIRDRLDSDAAVLQKSCDLHGVPKIYVRNSTPVASAKATVDDYEITKTVSYHWDEKLKKVDLARAEWKFLDDTGVESYGLLPAPVMVSLIKQLHQVLTGK